MIPTAFEYHAPESVAEIVSLLAEAGDDARPLAGGTWLVPDLNAGEACPRLVVDLRRAGLGAITAGTDALRIGATATYADLLASRDVRAGAPLLARMAAGITGGTAIRAQGTVGGSLAAARPASDVPAVLVALDGRAVIAGPEGERRVPVRELIAGAMRTTIRPDELLVAIEVMAHGGRHGYVKLKRGESSWPIATAAALLDIHGDGRCRAGRLVLGGVAGRPVEVDVTAALEGAQRSPDALGEIARLATAAVVEPWDDVLAPGTYRAAVAGPVARRAIEEAWEAEGTWN
jgi:aerobic carbon-monoxide dehydrogenase medium subunit